MSGPRWLAVYEDAGEVRFRVGRDGDDYVAEWVGLARVITDRSGARWRVTFAEDAGALERAKLERGGLVLLRRQLDGELALHGSAVAVDGRAVVMLGGSGLGKSTLAAALVAGGGELLADDAVAVEGSPARVIATERDHWLDAAAREHLGLAPLDADRAKGPLAARAVAGGAELAAVVELAWSDVGPPSLTRLEGMQALGRVLPHVVRLVLDDASLQRRELDQLDVLLARTPTFVLARPRSFAALGASVDMVRALCSKDPKVSV